MVEQVTRPEGVAQVRKNVAVRCNPRLPAERDIGDGVDVSAPGEERLNTATIPVVWTVAPLVANTVIVVVDVGTPKPLPVPHPARPRDKPARTTR